jgi:tetratricopeptide (TPR) repeat protein
MNRWLVLLLVMVGAGGYYLYDNREVGLPMNSSTSIEGPPELSSSESLRLRQHRVEHGDARPSNGLEVAADDLPVHWSELNDRAIEALERGQLELAVDLFELCMEGMPEQSVFAKNLAEALARLARHRLDLEPSALDKALALLERATELDPSRQDLRKLLERWKVSLATEAGFWTDETAHFSLSYDGSRTELLKHGYSELTGLLESVYDEFGVLLNHFPVGHGNPKLRVLLYDRDEFTKVTGVGHWAGGVFDGTVRVPVADYAAERKEIERVLRHELLHAFVRSYGGADVPAWLNEGLAQRLEGAAIDARTQRAKEKLAGQRLFSLEELEPSFTRMPDEGRIGVAYSQSMVIVDYLFRWYGEALVFELLRGCKEGRTCAQTFRDRTALDLSVVAQDAATR